MNQEVYRKLVKEYDIKRQIAIDKSKIKVEEIYAKIPKLLELKNEQNAISLKTAKLMLNADELTKQVELEKLEFKTNQIEEKIEKLLKQEGYTKQDLEPNYECKICNDTGMVRDGDKTNYCRCFTQRVINITYDQSNMNNLDEENFETFDFGYYSSKVDAEKFGMDKSPLENIKSIKKVSENFCNNIDSKNEKNLLFIGNTGLGKTFLANSIASAVMKKGKTVVYQTAPILMDVVLEYKFATNKDNSNKEQYNKVFDVDLLIIDDLGTETMISHKITEFFNIINTRLINNKKIIISTNLTLNELYKKYDERLVSRLIGNFTICKFIGEDIRLKKKRIN